MRASACARASGWGIPAQRVAMRDRRHRGGRAIAMGSAEEKHKHVDRIVHCTSVARSENALKVWPIRSFSNRAAKSV